MRLFTVSGILLGIFLMSCGDNQPSLPAATEIQEEKEFIPNDIGDFKGRDSTIVNQLLGKWELTHINGQSIGNDPDLAGNTQAFLSDQSWVWMHQTPGDSAVAVEGGYWHYDGDTRSINIIFSDSINHIYYLTELKSNRITLEKMDQSAQTWRRAGVINEPPPVKSSRP